MKINRMISIAIGIVVSTMGSRAMTPQDTEPILDHIVEPREAMSLMPTNMWKFATVTNGTDWSDANIRWQSIDIAKSGFWRGGDKDPKPNVDYYRCEIPLTAEQAKNGGAVFFELIAPHYEVRFNGKRVGYEDKLVGTIPQRFDVSGLLREGSNFLEVMLFRLSTPGHLMPCYGFIWQEGKWQGISRPVHFELYNRVNIKELRLETKVFPSKTFLVETTVTNTTDKAVSISVAGEVEEDSSVKFSASAQTIPPHEARVFSMKTDWAAARLWNPDEPNLYHLIVKTFANGEKKESDVLRQRFGFREIGYTGKQLTINGIPMLLRRETFGYGGRHYESDKAKELAAYLKKMGYNSSRCSTEVLLRDARVADEVGYILTPLAITGGPYERWDAYWTPCSNLVENLVRTFRNHPSISHWSLFNEFGPKFGVPLKQSAKTAAIGEFAMSLDPTRFWVSTGDFEMSSEGMQASGPTKMRSLHYPINLGWGFVPDVAYWLANDGDYGSWNVDYKKPVGISEDLFHGMNDNPRVMGQWGNDAIYTPEGYCAAWRKVMEYFCDGYYYSGLSEWNPWSTDPTCKYNWLYRDGPIMPDFLISRRHAFPNIGSEEKFSDKLFVFNKTFTTRKCLLVREDLFNDKRVLNETKEVTIKAGEFETLELAFTAPRVKASKLSGRYSANFKLLDGTNTLAKRTFAFNVIPETEKFDRNVFLIDYTPTNSPVRALFDAKNIYTNAASALAKATKKTTILVAGLVPGDEGKALDKWVFGGGRATLLIGGSVGWSPVEILDKQYHNFSWRRTAGFLEHEDESLWSVWRPTGKLSLKALAKESTLDIDVLLDYCYDSGFVNADALRVWRNRGSWLVTSMPIEECFNVEPAAKYLVTRFVEDQREGNGTPRTKGYSFATKGHPYESIFTQNGFPKAMPIPMNVGKDSPVVIANGMKRLSNELQNKLLNYARKGGTVLVTEATETNRAFLAKLGLGIHPRGSVFSFIGTKYTAHWTTPFGYRGVVNEPYYKPEIISGKEPFTEEQIDMICEKLENKGQIGIRNQCPENKPFLDRKRIEWREANMDWFTRVGSPAVLNGVVNSDLHFSKLSLDRYNCWMMRKEPEQAEASMDMYSRTPEAISTGSLFQLTGDKEETRGIKEELPARDKAAKDAVFCTNPAILAEVQVGKGKIYVLTLDSANFRGKYPRKFMRLYRQILGNLGVKTSTQTELVRYQTTENVSKREYQLWDNKKYDKPAKVLFENGEDLRYFPVNQRGWSLASGNECPVESFPEEPINLGGIPFKIPMPSFRDGSSVNVDAGGYGMLGSPPVQGYRARKVWMLAALDKVPTDPKVLSGEKPVIAFTWIFHDSEGKQIRNTSYAYYGKEIGAYMKPIALTGNGRIAWEGHTGTGKPAVLYAFSMDNPFDINEPIYGIHYRTCGGGVKTAVFAITWEPL